MYAYVSLRQHTSAYTLLSSAASPPLLQCTPQKNASPQLSEFVLVCWCSSKASKMSTSTEERRPPHARLSTARAPSEPCPNIRVRAEVQEGLEQLLRCQYFYYLYFCTSKLSKTEYLDCARLFALHCFVERALAAQSGSVHVSRVFCDEDVDELDVAAVRGVVEGRHVLVVAVACVDEAYASIRQDTSALRQNTSGYVSIRQHTSDGGCCCRLCG